MAEELPPIPEGRSPECSYTNLLCRYDIITPSDGDTAVALGFFDGVHLGHRAVIETMVSRAAAMALTPCVFTFSTDGDIPASKGELTLLQTQSHKETILAELGVRELRCPPFGDFCSLTPERFVTELLHGVLHARLLVCGDNYRFGKAAAAGVTELRALAQPLGIQVVTAPSVLLEGELVSSTRIRQTLRDGDVQLAARLLGTPFTIEGTILHGNRLGHTIGSPTINQAIPPNLTVPLHGVYLSTVTTTLGCYHGVTNIGVRPTVGGGTLNCETYLIGFDGDLYGEHITTALRQLLRPERRFASVAELAEQIQRDIQQAVRLASELVN